MPGIWNVNSKCPALQKLRLQVPGNVTCKCPSLQKLKSDSRLPKKFLFICSNERPLKMMENALYFILKTLFILKIFKFLSWHFGLVEEMAWLERQGYRKTRLISKFLMSKPG